jgi:hypothetical protein
MSTTGLSAVLSDLIFTVPRLLGVTRPPHKVQAVAGGAYSLATSGYRQLPPAETEENYYAMMDITKMAA